MFASETPGDCPAPAVSSLCEGMPRQPATSSDERSPQQCAARSPRHACRLAGFECRFATRPCPDGRSLIPVAWTSRRNRPRDGRGRSLDGTGPARSIRATNSPLTSGMHHSFFFHGLVRFFKYLAHRLEGDARPPCRQAVAASSPCVLRVLHATAIRCASCLPSNLRFCPRVRSLSALSSPSFTNRVRTRPTVDVLIALA